MIIPAAGSDVKEVQRRAHQLVAVAQVREPEGGVWHPLIVSSGTVTLAPIGALPSRTASVSVMSWSDDTDDVTDWLTPFGSWIWLAHDVVRANSTRFRVPLGFFRVDKITLNPLDGTLTIEASDAGVLVADYGLTTLADGQVTTTRTYLSALTAMLNATLSGIPPWWKTGVDPGSASTTAKPKSRLQYTGSRTTAAADLANRLGRKIIMPPDGRAAFRLVVARDSTDASDITIRGGQLGNMEQLSTLIDRGGIANVAVITYTREVRVAGARTRVEQRRLIDSYVNPDADTAAGGPFGRVTIDVDSTNVETDAEAIAAADAVLKRSLSSVRDVTMDTSPIYGLECGDIIRMEDSQGVATKGILIGATVGLTAADTWSLTVRTFVPVGKWSGPRRTVLTDAYQVRDDSDWQDYTSKAVDLTGATTKGWNADGGSVKDGGSRLLFTSSGTATSRLHTSVPFTVPGEHRIRVSFSVKAETRGIRARAYVDPNNTGPKYGAFVYIPKGKSATVRADLTLSGGSTFTFGVDFDQAGGGVLPDGSKVMVGNAAAERAVRKPQ